MFDAMQDSPKALIKKHLIELYRGVAYEGSRDNKLRLDLNESVDGLPEDFVRQVLDGFDARRLTMYPDAGPFTTRLAESLGVEVGNVVLGNGSDSSISDLYLATISPGDRILCTDPTFAMYPVYARIHQADVEMVSYEENLDFPFERFLERIDSGVRLVVVVNPNNPTGSVARPEHIERLAERAQENGVILVVDEAYHHYLGETSVALVGRYDNVIVMRTYSKLYGLASLRLGFSVASEGIIRGIRAVRPTFDVNSVALAFGEALFDRPDIIEQGLVQVRDGRRWLCDRLDEAGMRYRAGAGNFMLIDPGCDPVEVRRLLEQDGVLVSGGFRQPFLAPYLRVTLGGVEKMRLFWNCFEAAVCRLGDS